MFLTDNLYSHRQQQGLMENPLEKIEENSYGGGDGYPSLRKPED